MISDYVLEHLDSCDKDTLHGICKELLAYREAERKAASWDDVEAWVKVRRRMIEFYDNTGTRRGQFCGEFEERPK